MDLSQYSLQLDILSEVYSLVIYNASNDLNLFVINYV